MRFDSIPWILWICLAHIHPIAGSSGGISPAFRFGRSSALDDPSGKSKIVRRSVSTVKCAKDLICRNNGTCKDHQCQCKENFLGHDCNIARCDRGWCSKLGGKCKDRKSCQCQRGFAGADCSGTKCGKNASISLTCFNGATCQSEKDTCHCRAGYTDDGSGCLLKICPHGNSCYSNNGRCTSTGCECLADAITGPDCSQTKCGKSGLTCHHGGNCASDKHCQCLHGWTGVNCNWRKCPGFKDLACYSNTCPPVGSPPICQCPAHAKGKDCSGITCGTSGLACFNGGTCNANTSTCTCLAGFGGADCQAARCAGHPSLFCYNGGCPPADSDPDAKCTCSDPYTGADCSQMMCSHSALTCYNGGECIDGRFCKCPPGYGGVDCRGKQCGSSFCYNGGECLIDPKSGSSTCSCHGNYTLADCSGEKCSEKGLICLNDATCEREDNGDYSCQCTGEWGGVDCSATPCRNALCYHGGYCDDDGKDTDGCVCDNGWQGADCRARSCGLNGPICHNGGSCMPMGFAGFQCHCEHPWFGETCEKQPCGNHGLICLNSGTCLLDGSDQGTPICQCLPGFGGDDCSAVSCGSDGGACFNGGRCNEATGTCICPPPLTSDDCRGNVCGAGTENTIVCQNDGICVWNADEEWACNCTQGWTGPYCMLRVCGKDVSTSLICAHEGTCIHSATTGSFACSCQPHWAGADCSAMRCSDSELLCYNQVDFDSTVCTSMGCDCLNDGYGADCRGVRCGPDSGRCYNGAKCINFEYGLCSSCLPGYNGSDCSQMACPGVKSGLCFNGGICSGGKTCLCGKRSDWAGEDCSERKCSGSYHCLNKGTCTNSNDRACHCPPNFFGRFCENRLEHDIEPKHDQLQKHQERQ